MTPNGISCHFFLKSSGPGLALWSDSCVKNKPCTVPLLALIARVVEVLTGAVTPETNRAPREVPWSEALLKLIQSRPKT
jgi:hypothetical protein